MIAFRAVSLFWLTGLALPQALRASSFLLALACLAAQTFIHIGAEARTPPECQAKKATSVRTSYLIRRCFPEKRLLELRSAINQRKSELTAAERETIEGFTRIFGIEIGVLRYLHGVASIRDTEPEDLVEKLAEKLDLHLALIEQIEALMADPSSGLLWQECLRKVQSGDYVQAAEMIVSAREKQLFDQAQQAGDSVSETERLAAVEGVIGQIALIRSSYDESVQRFLAASELLPEGDRKTRVYSEAAADALYIQSKDSWDDAGLQRAIGIYRQILKSWPHASGPASWAETQRKLGSALLRLGARDGNADILLQAANAFRAALDVRQKENARDGWAKAQADLGAVLFRLGTQAQDEDSLKASVAAYRLSLGEIDSRSAPEDWASRQNALGAALWSLGSQNDKGRIYLEQAVTAFPEALKGINASRNPRDWGATYNNLGAALFALAEGDSGETYLKRAIEAFKSSLSAYQDVSALYYVVGVKTNLANAEAVLRERRSAKNRR